MSAALPSSQRWLRALKARRERWIGVGFLCAAAMLIGLGGQLSLVLQVVLGALLLFVLAMCLRNGWVHLFGPVLVYDLVRTARHSRTFLLRGVYAAVLLSILLVLYSEWFAGARRGGWEALIIQPHIPHADMARFAELFFTRFLSAQLAMVFLLTPAYTATAIAEEKERRSLDFLLATDLRSREIVLGKLASRFAHLVLFVLAGLPVLVLMQFLGGVDPHLALAGFAGTALTMLSLASLGILISAYAERPRSAIFITYLLAWLFVMCSFPIPGLNAANPLAAWDELMRAAEAGALAAEMPQVLRRYALIHGLMAGVCCYWASIRLRWWGQPQSAREQEMMVVRVNTYDGTRLVWRRVQPEVPRRPKVSDAALLWKEKYVESIWNRRSGIQSFFLFLTILGSSITGLFFLMVLAVTLGSTNGDGRIANIWVRTVGTPLACLLLLGVALRAAGAFSKEREQRTWDSLLTTPLELREIFWAKAWGSVLSVRWGWCFLAAVWLLGTLTLGLHPLAVLLLAMAWLIHASLVAGVGLWASLASRTTLRATLYTLLVLAGLHLGPLFVGDWFRDWVMTTWWNEFSIDQFLTFGVCPAPNLWMLATYPGDLLGADYHVADSHFRQEFTAACAGVFVLALVSLFLWRRLWFRFLKTLDRSRES
jgi:ABC-type transport system involved in multi-copper enzyme maturation permease subunit